MEWNWIKGNWRMVRGMSTRGSIPPRLLRAALAVVPLGALAGACAPEDGSPEETAETRDAPNPSEAPVQQVEVGLADFEIRLAHMTPAGPADGARPGQTDMPMGGVDTIPAGTVAFQIRNTGSTPHNFEIEGAGIEEELPQDLAPGETGTLTVELSPGTYHLYCPIQNHAQLGMSRELVVTEAVPRSRGEADRYP